METREYVITVEPGDWTILQVMACEANMTEKLVLERAVQFSLRFWWMERRPDPGYHNGDRS
jgi:hypothetical protein